MSLLDDLSDDVRAGRVVVIAGAGVSVASCEQAKDWPTLLRSGVERALDYNRTLPEEWKRIVDVELDTAATYPQSLPGVASKVVTALGGRAGPELSAWLRKEFSSLKVETPELIDALDGLGSPLLTTNFDHLLENRLGRETATWKSPSQMQSILQGRTKDVGHLHGSWREPRSVILSEQSYGEIIGNDGARAIQEALTAARTVLFVGCGAGIADPNFESLRAWMKKLWATSESRHYRLCLDSEVSSLEIAHQGERITPLGFGSNYDQLPGFLTGLGSAASIELIGAASAPAISAKALNERIVSEAVLTEHLSDDVCSWERLTIPPVLLPVSQEQFVRSQDLPKDERPKRLDPSVEALEPGCTVIVADDRVGLTTALEWLTLKRHALDGRAVPIVIDFKHVSVGTKPLRKQIIKELRISGVSIRDNASLPTVTLALDNFSSRPEKICSRVMEELRVGDFDRVMIGCKQGQESETLDALKLAGISASVRYLGRLNHGDIHQLAGLVAPSRAERLANKALDIAHREHLPRTPFTLSLLISAILHGEALLSTASETALLDAYLNLLMGRGDPHEDARFSLDAHERADILGDLGRSVSSQARWLVAGVRCSGDPGRILQRRGLERGPTRCAKQPACAAPFDDSFRPYCFYPSELFASLRSQTSDDLGRVSEIASRRPSLLRAHCGALRRLDSGRSANPRNRGEAALGGVGGACKLHQLRNRFGWDGRFDRGLGQPLEHP